MRLKEFLLDRAALAGMRFGATDVATVVDDLEADVAGAKRAGLRAVQVRTGKWGPGDDAGEAYLPAAIGL